MTPRTQSTYRSNHHLWSSKRQKLDEIQFKVNNKKRESKFKTKIYLLTLTRKEDDLDGASQGNEESKILTATNAWLLFLESSHVVLEENRELIHQQDGAIPRNIFRFLYIGSQKQNKGPNHFWSSQKFFSCASEKWSKLNLDQLTPVFELAL